MASRQTNLSASFKKNYSLSVDPDTINPKWQHVYIYNRWLQECFLRCITRCWFFEGNHIGRTNFETCSPAHRILRKSRDRVPQISIFWALNTGRCRFLRETLGVASKENQRETACVGSSPLPAQTRSPRTPPSPHSATSIRIRIAAWTFACAAATRSERFSWRRRSRCLRLERFQRLVAKWPWAFQNQRLAPVNLRFNPTLK